MSVALNKSVHVNAPLTVHRGGVVVAKVVDKRVEISAPVAMGVRGATGRDGLDGVDGLDGDAVQQEAIDRLSEGAYWGVEDW